MSDKDSIYSLRLKKNFLNAPARMVSMLAKAVRSNDEISNLAKSITFFLEEKGQLHTILRWCIRDDVKHADTWAELFRGRTLAVAILTEYVNTMCRGYLRIAVGSIVKKLISQKKTLEVDPFYEKSSQVIEENAIKLIELGREFLDTIINSLGSCPITLRKTMAYLTRQVDKKFPSQGKVVLAAFAFSRVFLPPILSPTILGFSKEQISKESNRTAILVSKLLQNVASGQTYEPTHFMGKFNDFILKNQTRVAQFLNELINVKSDDPDTPTAYVSSELSNFAFNGIHYYLFKYKQDLTNQINAKVKRDGESPDMKIASDIITFVEASELAEGKPENIDYEKLVLEDSRQRAPTISSDRQPKKPTTERRQHSNPPMRSLSISVPMKGGSTTSTPSSEGTGTRSVTPKAEGLESVGVLYVRKTSKHELLSSASTPLLNASEQHASMQSVNEYQKSTSTVKKLQKSARDKEKLMEIFSKRVQEVQRYRKNKRQKVLEARETLRRTYFPFYDDDLYILLRERGPKYIDRLSSSLKFSSSREFLFTRSKTKIPRNQSESSSAESKQTTQQGISSENPHDAKSSLHSVLRLKRDIRDKTRRLEKTRSNQPGSKEEDYSILESPRRRIFPQSGTGTNTNIRHPIEAKLPHSSRSSENLRTAKEAQIIVVPPSPRHSTSKTTSSSEQTHSKSQQQSTSLQSSTESSSLPLKPLAATAGSRVASSVTTSNTEDTKIDNSSIDTSNTSTTRENTNKQTDPDKSYVSSTALNTNTGSSNPGGGRIFKNPRK